MAEPQSPKDEAEQPAETASRGGFPLKTALIVLVAFVLQVAVVLLVIHLAQPRAATAAASGADGGTGTAPAGGLTILDLDTYNITQYQLGDPVNRRQLAVEMGLSIDKDASAGDRRRIEDQRLWIGQLLDEVLGPLPLDAIHSSRREPIKQQLKAKINERIGADVVKEVILRIQTFGP